MKRSSPQPLNPNPVQQAASFAPPPTGVVTIASMAKETLAYWKTQRIAFLSGYKISWVIPGREGAVSTSTSVWNLDPRVQPIEEIHPARTARYEIEAYVLVGGRPYIEPPLGTRITVNASANANARSSDLAVNATVAPTGLGETARWLPDPAKYVGGLWSPSAAPVGTDSAIKWAGSEKNLPEIYDEFSYARRGDWVTTDAMLVPESAYFRLDGMSLYSGGVPLAPITMFFVASLVMPSKYWGSLLRAVEADGSSPANVTNLDLRIMPDGQLHPYTWGWQEALPLATENHVVSLFGFTMDPMLNSLTLFTVDKNLQFAEMEMPYPHSQTSKFVLGRSAEAVYSLYVLDILFYRGAMTTDRISDIASELDAAYGITARLWQEQG